MAAWHWIDYVIIGVIAVSVVTGLIRGFIKELISLCVWIIAGWLAFVYAKPVAHWLSTYVQDKSAQVVLAYILIIVGTLVMGGVINALLSFIMHRSGLSGTDRLLGVGFGFIRGVFVVGLIMVVIKLSGMPEKDYQEKSLIYAQFNPLVNWMYQYAPGLIKHVETLEHGAQSEQEVRAKVVESL